MRSPMFTTDCWSGSLSAGTVEPVFPSVLEITKALLGTLLFAGRRPSAPAMFTCTPEGFWRAILGQALAVPAYAMITMRAIEADPKASYGVSDGIVDVLIHVIVLLAYPAVLDHIASFLGRRDRLLDYLVPYLWVSIPVNYLVAAGSMVTDDVSLSPGFRATVGILIYGFALFLHWEIVRRQLSVGGSMAFGVMVFELVFTVSVMTVLASFASN